jgi:hypothetical protein
VSALTYGATLPLLNPQTLSDEDKRAFLLLTVYEEERKRVQRGYRAFDAPDAYVTQTAIWKTCRTVAKWLEERGWDLTYMQVHWRGYVRYVFQALRPAIPMPGQMKNDFLLRGYLRSPVESKPPAKSDQELSDLYSRILSPDIARLPCVRRRLCIETPGAD